VHALKLAGHRVEGDSRAGDLVRATDENVRSAIAIRERPHRVRQPAEWHSNAAGHGVGDRGRRESDNDQEPDQCCGCSLRLALRVGPVPYERSDQSIGGADRDERLKCD